MNKSVLLLICVALFSSCKVTQKMAVTAPVEDVGVHQYPTVADLDVKPQKVTKTEEWNYVPFNWGQPSLEIRKGNMIAEMVETNGGDVLLEPQTVYTKRAFGKRSLTVSGFVASFDNFRKATDEDLEALEIGYRNSERPVYNVAKKPLFPNLMKKVKTSKKGAGNEYKVVVGFTGNGLVGHDDSNGRKMGYNVGFEYKRHTPSNFYYNAGIGFAGRGFDVSETTLMSHVINLMPAGVGYNYPINDNLSVYANLGWYMDISMSENLDYDRYEIDTSGIFDTGFRYGIGVKYGKFSLELMNYSGLIDRIYDEDYERYYKQKSLTFSLGISF